MRIHHSGGGKGPQAQNSWGGQKAEKGHLTAQRGMWFWPIHPPLAPQGSKTEHGVPRGCVSGWGGVES